MEYSKLISVTGLSGLYELIGSKADGAIVRSLEDKKHKNLFHPAYTVSPISKA